MVAELDITDQDVTEIAKMIDGEITSLVPEWRSGVGFEDNKAINCCHICTSDAEGYSLHGPKHGCGAVHGRFEEITYPFEGDEQQQHSLEVSSDEHNDLGD